MAKQLEITLRISGNIITYLKNIKEDITDEQIKEIYKGFVEHNLCIHHDGDEELFDIFMENNGSDYI